MNFNGLVFLYAFQKYLLYQGFCILAAIRKHRVNALWPQPRVNVNQQYWIGIGTCHPSSSSVRRERLDPTSIQAVLCSQIQRKETIATGRTFSLQEAKQCLVRGLEARATIPYSIAIVVLSGHSSPFQGCVTACKGERSVDMH